MNVERVMKVLQAPKITEKASIIADKYRQFAFKVATDAKKLEIKQAVELLYNVKVKSVAVLNVKAKTKRFKQVPGKRSAWKKAYVTLQEGFDIDFTQSNN